MRCFVLLFLATIWSPASVSRGCGRFHGGSSLEHRGGDLYCGPDDCSLRGLLSGRNAVCRFIFSRRKACLESAILLLLFSGRLREGRSGNDSNRGAALQRFAFWKGVDPKISPLSPPFGRAGFCWTWTSSCDCLAGLALLNGAISHGATVGLDPLHLFGVLPCRAKCRSGYPNSHVRRSSFLGGILIHLSGYIFTDKNPAKKCHPLFLGTLVLSESSSFFGRSFK